MKVAVIDCSGNVGKTTIARSTWAVRHYVLRPPTRSVP